MQILKDKIKELLKQFEEELKKTSSPPPIIHLYHYTSFSNFIRIINSRELCFTDYRHLNDPTEFLLSKSVLEKVIKEKKGDNSEICSEFLSDISDIVDKESFMKNRHL